MLGYFLSGPIAHQIIISNWYSRRRGQAMRIAYVGGALLGAMGNKLNPWLVTFLPYIDALKVSSFVMLLAWPVAIVILGVVRKTWASCPMVSRCRFSGRSIRRRTRSPNSCASRPIGCCCSAAASIDSIRDSAVTVDPD
jgi:MFS family permease